MTAPATVLGIAVGLVLIVVGQRIENRTENAIVLDEELAPVDESSLERYERDEQ